MLTRYNYCALYSARLNYYHVFDIVTGKAANDNVGETVAYFVQGIMRREAALDRLRFEKIQNQVCFNAAKALSHLKYIEKNFRKNEPDNFFLHLT